MKKYKKFYESKKSNKLVLNVNRDIEIDLKDVIEVLEYEVNVELGDTNFDLNLKNLYKTDEEFKNKVNKICLQNLHEHLKNLPEVIQFKDHQIDEMLLDENLKEYIKKRREFKDLNI
jgi:hypothetical protein